jgi:hypothetical protein
MAAVYIIPWDKKIVDVGCFLFIYYYVLISGLLLFPLMTCFFGGVKVLEFQLLLCKYFCLL